MKQGLIILTMLVFTACNELIGERGNNERITKEITVEAFEKIEVSGAFDIVLKPSESDKVILEADERRRASVMISSSIKLSFDGAPVD